MESYVCLFCLIVCLTSLGIRKEDLPKYEEQLDLKIAKAQLEELKKDALEAMETQKKRYVSYDMMNLFPFYGVAPGTFVSWVVG